jgi:hypothetical protein
MMWNTTNYLFIIHSIWRRYGSDWEKNFAKGFGRQRGFILISKLWSINLIFAQNIRLFYPVCSYIRDNELDIF